MQKQSNTAKKTSSAAQSRGGQQKQAHKDTNSRATASNRPNRDSSGSGKRGQQQSVDDSRLKEFFLDEIKDIYWAEQKLVKTLPKLQKAASSRELQQAFGSHLEETKGHVKRLEQVFEILGEKAKAKKCDAMEGITEEGASVIEDTDAGTATRDVALVMAGQKAEHYEIATYGGLIELATTLGHQDIADLLKATLQEEKAADEKLTSIARSGINYAAAEEKE